MPRAKTPSAEIQSHPIQPDTPRSGPSIWLCLAGGNALGAFQAGFCDALAEREIEPAMIAGTSVGAIVGALIAGNPPDRRRAALGRFMQAARQTTPAQMGFPWLDLQQRRWTLLRNMLAGHSGLFRPVSPGFWTVLSGSQTVGHLYDRPAMQALLATLIDFDLLNAAAVPLLFTALDGETGEVVDFDTRREPITVEHLMAASAAPVLFAPVRIEGRVLVDAGLRANLPLHLLAGEPAPGRVACLAVDLFPAAMAPYPDSLTAIAARAQDLFFAGQSLSAMETFARMRVQGDALDLVHLVHDDPRDATAGKALDFSAHVLDRRWDAGRSAAEGVLDRIIA